MCLIRRIILENLVIEHIVKTYEPMEALWEILEFYKERYAGRMGSHGGDFTYFLKEHPIILEYCNGKTINQLEWLEYKTKRTDEKLEEVRREFKTTYSKRR